MKKLLLSLLIAGSVHAETLPQGCYVANGTTDCFQTPDDVIGFYTHAIVSGDQELSYYGQVVASLLDAYFQKDHDLQLMRRENRKLKRELRRVTR